MLSKPQKVRLREKGQFTIPAEFRRRMGLEDNVVLDVYQVGKAIIATPEPLAVRELARQVQQELHKSKYNLSDLLAELREGPHEYHEED